MFGYVRPYRPSLPIGDYEFYRAIYCGVCRAMKKETGALSALALNYDFVFLATVRLLVEENHVSLRPRRCIAHPLRRRPMVTDHPAVDYAARVCSVLVYHKLKDDLHDRRFLGRVPPAAALTVFSRARRRARLGELDALIADRLDALSVLEKQRVPSIDAPATVFGELLGEVFAFGTSGALRETLYGMGHAIGRFIYAADAAEDFDDDVRSGSYNPYVLTYGEALSEDARRDIHTALLCMLSEGERAWQALPFGTTVTVRRLIENVLYDGLPHRIEFLLTGEKKPRRTPAPYDGELP